MPERKGAPERAPLGLPAALSSRKEEATKRLAAPPSLPPAWPACGARLPTQPPAHPPTADGAARGRVPERGVVDGSLPQLDRFLNAQVPAPAGQAAEGGTGPPCNISCIQALS